MCVYVRMQEKKNPFPKSNFKFDSFNSQAMCFGSFDLYNTVRGSRNTESRIIIHGTIQSIIRCCIFLAYTTMNDIQLYG